MKGKHKIEVRSKRIVFTIELERNITILRGDSATGKTTLVEMLSAYENYGRKSGITIVCDKTCRVLSGALWEAQLKDIQEQKTLRFFPEWVPAGPFALGVGHQGRDQFQNVLFAVDIGEGVIVHGLFEVDGVQDFQLVTVFQKCVPALDHDTTFRERSVKIENGKVTNNFQFRNLLFSHHHASVASSCPPECPCSSC